METRTDKDTLRLFGWCVVLVCSVVPFFRFPNLRLFILIIFFFSAYKALKWYWYIERKNQPDYDSIEWEDAEEIFLVGGELCRRIRAYERGLSFATEAADIEEIVEQWRVNIGSGYDDEEYNFPVDTDDIDEIIAFLQKKRTECLNGLLECSVRFALWYTKTVEKSTVNNIRRMWEERKREQQEEKRREKELEKEPVKVVTHATNGWVYTTIPYAKGISEGIVRCHRCKNVFGLHNGQADILAMYNGKRKNKDEEVYMYRFCSYKCLNLWLEEPDPDNSEYKKSIKSKRTTVTIK